MGSRQFTWAYVESWDGALGPNRVGLLARGTPMPHPSHGGAVCIAWQHPLPCWSLLHPRRSPLSFLSVMCPRALRTLGFLGAPG